RRGVPRGRRPRLQRAGPHLLPPALRHAARAAVPRGPIAMSPPCLAVALLLAAATATAAAPPVDDPVDVGIVAAGEVDVVQNLLYPKAGRTELGASLGWMTFDPYLMTPNAQLSLDVHPSEWFGWSFVVGG